MIPKTKQTTSVNNIIQQPKRCFLKSQKSTTNFNKHIPQFILTKSSHLVQSLHPKNFKAESKQSQLLNSPKIDIKQMKSVFTSPVSKNNQENFTFFQNLRSKTMVPQSQQYRLFENIFVSKDKSSSSNSLQIIPKMKKSTQKRFYKIKTQQKQANQNKKFDKNKIYFCRNHSNAIAQYQLNLKNQKRYYYNNQANDLKKQSFNISKIYKPINKFKFGTMSLSNPEENFREITFSQNNIKLIPQVDPLNCQSQRQQNIKDFLLKLQNSKDKHNKVLQQCLSISQHYLDQIEKVDSFYYTLLQILEGYRHNHIKGLEMECNFLTKDYQRQIIYLRKSSKDLNDIQTQLKFKFGNNLDQNETNVKNSLKYYHHTVKTLNLRVQKIQDSLRNLPKYNIETLQKIIKQIQDKIQTIANGIYSRSIYTCLKPIDIKMKDIHTRKTIGSNDRKKIWDIINLNSNQKNQQLEEIKNNKNGFKKQWKAVINKDKMYDFPDYQSIRSSNKVFNSIVIPQSDGFTTKLRKCFSDENLTNNEILFNSQDQSQAQSPQFRKLLNY